MRKIAVATAALGILFVLMRPSLRNFLHNRNNKNIFIETEGSGRKVLMIHGLTGTHSYWKPLATVLSQNYTVITPDLIGFGESPWPADGYHMDDQIASLTPILADAHDIVLIGHSLGSLVAIEMAKRFPDKIAKVILLAPPSFENRLDLKKVLAEESNVQSMMALDTFWAPLICHFHEVMGALSYYLYRPFVQPEIPDFIIKDGTKHRWESYNQSLESIVLQYKATDELKTLMTPNLVLVGSDDRYSKNEILLRTHKQVRVIPGGHNFLWESPATTIDAIKTFIENGNHLSK